MIKNYLEFMQADEAIKLAEDGLMRPLTVDEKEMIIVKGFGALMESLEVSAEDWKMLAEVKTVLTAYTSGDEEAFMETLPKCPLARDFFEFILAAYDAANDMKEEELANDTDMCQVTSNDMCTNPCIEQTPVDELVSRMASGETITLDDETMHKVCNHLASNFMNYIFRSVNGESSLKVE
jgi:hypothetical protein